MSETTMAPAGGEMPARPHPMAGIEHRHEAGPLGLCMICGHPHDGNEISVWAVFHDAPEFPGVWCARRFTLGAGTTRAAREAIVADSLPDLRAQLPPGLARYEGLPVKEQVQEVWG